MKVLIEILKQEMRTRIKEFGYHQSKLQLNTDQQWADDLTILTLISILGPKVD